MSIDREAVRHVADLCRIGMDEIEMDRYVDELNEVLKFMAKLEELDTNGIEPTVHVLPIQNVFRQDNVMEGLDVEDVLANAPDREDDCFKVPSIL